MTKVFILALDGLEYNLVKSWKLKNLMQEKYGKIALTPSYYHSDEYVPYTPTIWASFITGLPPKQHGIKVFFTYGKTLDFIRKLHILKWIRGKRKIFRKLGLKPRAVNRRDLKAHTLFDEIKPSIAIDVPAYNEPADVFQRLNDVLIKGGLKEYEKEIWRIYEERKRRVFANFFKEWKIFMAYFNITDLMGHLYIAKRLQTLKHVYEMMNDLAFNLRRPLQGNVIFLIVSDHGMQPEPDGTGSHSLHAFYSLNVRTKWVPQNITSFYSKILEWIKNS